MADQQKFRTHESLNVDTAADWNVLTALTAAVSGGSTVEKDVSSYNQIGVYSVTNDVYFSFSSSASTSIVTAKDLVLPSKTLTFLKIPKGLGSTVYFIVLSTSGSVTSSVKIIGM
jgi:hypothetical protein